MKNCLKLFLLLCTLLAVSALSALEGPTYRYQKLLVESTNDPYIPIIDLIAEGESYQIEILSIGCFNGSKQTFAIFREANAYSVDFEGTTRALNGSEVNAIRDFELELQSLKIGGCSTVDTYKLTYGDDSYSVSDGTCSFNGGRKLMKRLRLVPGK